jgi:hypothetical protein
VPTKTRSIAPSAIIRATIVPDQRYVDAGLHQLPRGSRLPCNSGRFTGIDANATRPRAPDIGAVAVPSSDGQGAGAVRQYAAVRFGSAARRAMRGTYGDPVRESLRRRL